MITTFSYYTLALVALAGVLHAVRVRGRFTPDSAMTAASGIAWLIAAFAIVASMIDQATHYPESMDPGALLTGSLTATWALLVALDAVLPGMIASARRADLAPAATDPKPSGRPDTERQ